MVVVFCSLLYASSTSYNLVLIIEICLFLEYKKIMLYILNLIPQLILSWVIYLVIGLMFLLLWPLHISWYLAPLVSFRRLILWSYSHLFSIFSHFFLLNKWVKDQIYSSKSSGFVGSGFFPISWYLLSISSIGIILLILDLNKMSWY